MDTVVSPLVSLPDNLFSSEKGNVEPFSMVPPKVGIGIPISDSVPAEAFASMLLLSSQVAKLGLDPYALTCQDVFPIHRARESILEQAIGEGLDYLWWVDSDVVIPSDALPKLLGTLQRNKGVALVTAHYYQRGGEFLSTWATYNEEKKEVERVNYDPSSTSPTWLVSCGLGCAVMDLKVVSKMTRPFFRNLLLENGDIIWEDGYFCHNILQSGGTILGDNRVECGHLGKRVLVNYKSISYLKSLG